MGLLEWFDWSFVVGVIDVLLVSFLFYKVLIFVKDTRALPMLAGLGMAMVVYLISKEFNLVTLNFIFGKFLDPVILIIVILFQDDLRRALTKVGLFPGLGSADPEELAHTVREVSRAAADLASRRLGGLIVIRRDVGLEEYTERAVEIGARVSHQLLMSIFLPTSPLHDGAVIIEGDKIIAAGAVLPLTFSSAVSSALGTRHRAAIGLSEHTDAIVVVVSEESGSISLVREGKITKALNETTLYNALHRLTVARYERRQSRGVNVFGVRLGAKKRVHSMATVSPEDSGVISEDSSGESRGSSEDTR